MGSFANTVFSIMLGWLQGLISMIWSALTAEDGGSFFTYIGNNWIKITVILCAVGLAADFAVYFFRWAPYKVWKTFWRRIRGAKKTDEYVPGKVTDHEPVFASRAGNEQEEYTYKWSSADHESIETEEPDDLDRWRTEEPETEETPPPAEITRAGYAVPADSPYRKPADRNRRRRIRINLLGDSDDEGEIHYYSPRPMVDQKEAYNAPVYPEKWSGGKEQDS